MQLLEEIQALMIKNSRQKGGFHYTVPSPELYPFQWLWDSCFHAIIYTHFDVERAKKEIRSVASHTLKNPTGLLPHIIYWEQVGANQDNNCWGREMRGDVINDAWQTQGTSSITQPPVIAYAAWRIYQIDRDQSFLEEIYPTLKLHFSVLDEERTFNGDALAYIINPDESGEDNSPRFDLGQELPPQHTANDNLDKRILRMTQNAECDFMAKKCMSKYFGVADVPFNILYAQDLEHLALIATELKDMAGIDTYKNRSEHIKRDMRTQLKDGNLFYAYDHIHNKPIKALTWAIFMPLYGELLEQKEAEDLVSEYLLSEKYFQTPYPLPTTAQSEAAYDPHEGFWRGPVWMAPNWFIYHGLKKYGFQDLADNIKDKSTSLLKASGFREHYHPETGAGLGAHDFTWGGLVLDMN